MVLSVLGPGRAAHLPSVVLQPSIFPVPGDGGSVKERERPVTTTTTTTVTGCTDGVRTVV